MSVKFDPWFENVDFASIEKRLFEQYTNVHWSSADYMEPMDPNIIDMEKKGEVFVKVNRDLYSTRSLDE